MKLNYPKASKGNCPKCGFLLDGGDIFETFKKMKTDGDPHYKDKTDKEIKEVAAMYGWSKENPKRFSKIIGIEIGHDEISYWKCPSCKTTWNRWTGEEEKVKDD